MLILKNQLFLLRNNWFAFDFPVIVDPLLRLEVRLCRDERTVMAVYLAISNALSPDSGVNIGKFEGQIFKYGVNAGINLRQA